MRLLLAVMTCHRYNYQLGPLTQDWLSLRNQRCLSQPSRIASQRATFLASLPAGMDYKIFYGRGGDRDPLPDEVFLECGDSYKDNPEKMWRIARYAIALGYEFLIRIDDDTFIYPERLLELPWQDNHYSGAPRDDFHPGGCLILSSYATRLISSHLNRARSHADDLEIGRIMRDAGVEMNGLPEIYHGMGEDYNVIPAKLPVEKLASLHSCQPKVMEELWRKRHDQLRRYREKANR